MLDKSKISSSITIGNKERFALEFRFETSGDWYVLLESTRVWIKNCFFGDWWQTTLTGGLVGTFNMISKRIKKKEFALIENELSESFYKTFENKELFNENFEKIDEEGIIGKFIHRINLCENYDDFLMGFYLQAEDKIVVYVQNFRNPNKRDYQIYDITHITLELEEFHRLIEDLVLIYDFLLEQYLAKWGVERFIRRE